MEDHRIDKEGNIIIVNDGLKVKPGVDTGEIISNLAARYELPPNRHVEIYQINMDGEYTALVTQGDNSVVKPGFKALDRAIEWARQQWPDQDVTGKEVSES